MDISKETWLELRHFIAEDEFDAVEHHGIKGQKWGVRRYQNSDGSYTDEGRKRHSLDAHKDNPNEKYATSNLKKANKFNLDKWGQDKNHNVLYVIGASGSGKSTTALGLSRKRDSVIHLDALLDEASHKTHANADFEDFCKSKGIDVDRARDTSIDIKDRIKTIDEVSKQIESYGRRCYSKGNKVAVEGVQLADETMFPDKSYFKDKPVITLHTSKLKSAARAATRDNDKIVDIFKDFADRDRSKWYDKIENGLKEIEEANQSYPKVIEHHGIKGQHWGITNGPPYPLGRSGETLSNGNAIKLTGYDGPAYFISEKKLDATELKPRVPKNYLTKNGYEDGETPRVSFAPSIDQCLAGLSQNLDDKTFYVYEPVDISKCEVYKPNKKAVPDSEITNELWITNPVEIKQVKKIKITGNRGEDGKVYSYGDKQAMLFDDWTYEEASDQ